jgi:hypothetical protein
VIGRDVWTRAITNAVALHAKFVSVMAREHSSAAEGHAAAMMILADAFRALEGRSEATIDQYIEMTSRGIRVLIDLPHDVDGAVTAFNGRRP